MYPSNLRGRVRDRQEKKGNILVDMVDLQVWLQEQEGRECLLKAKFNYSPWAKSLNAIRIRIL